MFINESKLKGRKPGTIRTYNTLFSRLTRFRESTHFNIRFETLDGRFRSQFESFLIEDLALEHSTVQKTFKILKRFLNYAWRLGLNENLDYQKWEGEQAKEKMPISPSQRGAYPTGII